MNEAVGDISFNLKSDKITTRARGRKSCFELIKSDASGELLVSNSDWKGILEGAVNGALQEMEYSLNKEKAHDIEVAVLLRVVVKHILAQGVYFSKSNKFEMVVKHSLTVLYHSSFSVQHKDEYRNILCEMLETKIVHSLSFDYLWSIFKYMQDVGFLTQRNTSESSNLKLLKQFCKALFMDYPGFPELLKALLFWFGNTLIPLTGDNPLSQAAMTATIADCWAMLLQYQGLNCANIFYANAKTILVPVIRQLSVNQLRDTQREPLLRFIYSYIKFSTSINMSETNKADEPSKFNRDAVNLDTVFPPLSELDPLHGTLYFLCEALTTDDALRSLVVYAYNRVRQGQARDSYVNALVDPKVLSNLMVTAIAVVLHQQQYAHTERDIPSYSRPFSRSQSQSQSQSVVSSGRSQRDTVEILDISNTSSSSSSSSSAAAATNSNQSAKRPRSEFQGTQNILPRNQPSYSDGFADLILKRMNSFTIQSTAYSQNGLNSNNIIAARHVASATLEGLMILLSVISRLFPNGEFLKENENENKNENENEKIKENENENNTKAGISCHVCDSNSFSRKLLEWIEVAFSKLLETLPLANEQQLQGSIFLALNGLADVTANIIRNIENQKGSGSFNEFQSSKIKEFRDIWTKIIRVMLSDSNLGRHLKLSRKNSMSECAYKLLHTLIANDLVQLPSKLYVLNRVLNFPGVKNPFGVDSPAFFQLISVAILKSDINSPESVGAELLSESQNSSYFRSKEIFQKERTDFSTDSTGVSTSTTIIIDENRNQNQNQVLDQVPLLYHLPSIYKKHSKNFVPVPRLESVALVPDRGVIYIICWLDQQLCGGGARMSVQTGWDIGLSLCRILNFSFSSFSDRTVDIEGDSTFLIIFSCILFF
jgi:hypothetical protein